jgi:uncharacterized membrane protein
VNKSLHERLWALVDKLAAGKITTEQYNSEVNKLFMEAQKGTK